MKNKLSLCKKFLASNMQNIFFYLSPLATFIMVEILEFGGTDSQCLYPTNLSFWANILFYYGIFLLFRAVTGRPRFTIIFLNFVFLVFAICNHYSIAIRNEPIVPWDLYAVGTAAEALGGFTWTIPAEIIACSIGCIIWWFITIKLIKFPKQKVRARAGSFALSAVMLTGFVLFGTIGSGNFYISAWRQVTANRRNGMALNFTINMDALFVEEPTDYSKETASTILSSVSSEETSTSEESVQPNIIVIMDETFADLSILGDLGLKNTNDVMPFVHSLSGQENTITGQLVVPAFGGGTCNSEYEFLTSNSYAFFKSGSYPMLQYIHNDTESMASVLSKQGYNTVGIHPYYGSGWNRQNAYPLLGFDTFLDIDDFDDETTEYLRRYVSDNSSFDKVIETYEKNNAESDDPLFLFNVTIQNHCGYDTTYANFSEDVEFEFDSLYPYTKQYLSLIQESDRAIERLVNYFSEQEEPTMVVLFGDHMPYIENSFYNHLSNGSLKTAAETELDQHTVPFFIWANYDINEEDYEDVGRISANYLGPLTMEVAGAPLSDYQEYVYSLMEQYPVISVSGCLNSDGVYVPLEMAASDLHDYKIVQYENVFDHDTTSKSTNGSADGSGG
ncbi:MAG: sulfatase-like hydrolase/transferase [Clostridia bacterium]|nr:sulfatase-like hydrolase/transferase [Clostridia bacterium]